MGSTLTYFDLYSIEFIIWWLHQVDNSRYFPYIFAFIWIFGMLGNLASLIVFSRKQSFTNFLFYWLSICDLLELGLIGLFGFFFNFHLMSMAQEFSNVNNPFEKYSDLIVQDPLFSVAVLLLFFHNISILLNIILAFSQYFMVVYPLKYRQLFSNGQFSKQKIIGGIFFIGFFLSYLMSLPSALNTGRRMMVEMKYNPGFGKGYLYRKLGEVSYYDEIISRLSFMTYLYFDKLNVEYSKIICEDNEEVTNHSVLYEDPRDESKQYFTEDYIEKRFKKLFFFNEPIFSMYKNGTGRKLKVGKGISILYYSRESWIAESWISILYFTVVRIGLLVVLMVACLGLILGIRKARLNHHNLVDSAQTLNHQTSMNSATNQMMNMTLVIVFIFFIVEIPIAVIFNSYWNLYTWEMMFDYHYMIGSPAIPTTVNDHDYNATKMLFNFLILISLFVSSSYTIFCYLIMNAQYRRTLKHVLYNGYKSLKNFYWLPNIQWWYRTTYQQTPQTFELG